MAGWDRLSVRALGRQDLAHLGWAGSQTHVRAVGEGLDRMANGDVIYLCVCGPANLPLAMGGVDFVHRPGAAEIWQLATMPALQSLGLGTMLIRALEDAARANGFGTVVLLVEVENDRALTLYQRLGYAVTGSEPASWDAEEDDGQIVRYTATCYAMTKALV